jgi:hypothetical protein
MDGFDRRFFAPARRRPEAVFDELRIGGRQQVPVGQSLVNPVGRLVGRRKANEFGNQTIAQHGGLFGRRTGFAGRTNFGLREPIGGLATNIFDFDIGAVDASSGPTPFPFLDGGSATIFAPTPRSGAQIVFSLRLLKRAFSMFSLNLFIRFWMVMVASAVSF